MSAETTPRRKVRSYAALVDRVRRAVAKNPAWTVSEMAVLEYPPGRYPLMALCRSAGPGAPRLSISAGIHGDEVAGVEAALRLLESDLRFASLHLTVLPCQNPFGYAHDTRFNGSGLDLNRQFDKPESPAQETRALRRFLLRSAPKLVVECHEDADADGFYAWEIKRPGRPELGRAVVDRVAAFAPVTKVRSIEGCFVTRGVAHPTAGRISRIGGWSHTYLLFQNGAPHCLTPETPSSFPLEDRVNMHLTAIRTALEMTAVAGDGACVR